MKVAYAGLFPKQDVVSLTGMHVPISDQLASAGRLRTLIVEPKPTRTKLLDGGNPENRCTLLDVVL
jgi:hypothetical protein